MSRETIGIGMVGHAFMGAVHSHAWRSVHRFFDPPLVPRLAVLGGRDETRARAAAEAEAMAEAARRARERGVRAMVAFNYRRVPALAHARNLVASGALGEIRHVRSVYLQDWLSDPEAPMTWRLRRESAGSGA